MLPGLDNAPIGPWFRRLSRALASSAGASLVGKQGGGTLQDLVADLAAGVAARIDCFGDSTGWGADPANLATQVAVPPPAALQNFVNNFHGNTALTVVNSAISGTTATQMIAGTDGSGAT